MALGPYVPIESLQKKCYKHFLKKKDRDGMLSYAEFKEAVKTIGVADQLTIGI